MSPVTVPRHNPTTRASTPLARPARAGADGWRQSLPCEQDSVQLGIITKETDRRGTRAHQADVEWPRGESLLMQEVEVHEDLVAEVVTKPSKAPESRLDQIKTSCAE